jgi:hypothetical protein
VVREQRLAWWSTAAAMTVTHFIVTGSISLCFSCITFVMIFLRWVITRRHVPWIVIYITLSDILTTIGYLMSTPRDHTALCSLQGYLTTTFPISSVCWTTVAAWKLYQSCHSPHTRIEISSQKQLSLWAICLLYGVLPLTTSRFGCASNETDCWCYVTDISSSSPSPWTSIWYYSFYVLLWAALCAYLLLCLYVFSFIHFTNQRIHSQLLSKQIYKLGGYPLVILLSWLPISIIEILSWSDSSTQFTSVGYVCVGLQGTFASIVYLMTNSSHWKCCRSKQVHLIPSADATPPPRFGPPKIYEMPPSTSPSPAQPTKLSHPSRLETPQPAALMLLTPPQELKLEEFSV